MLMSNRTHTRTVRVTAYDEGGFTLIELVIVTAIISVLIGILLPAVQKIKTTSAKLSASRHEEVKDFGRRLAGYADETGPSLQENSWAIVAATANGPEAAPLDPELLRQLYEDLLGREASGNDFQRQADALLERPGISPEDRALLLDAKSGVTELLDAIKKIKAVLARRVE